VDEGDLLRYADGEVKAREERQIRAHLAACWQCRTALDELQQTISECVRYRRATLGASLPDPPAPWFDILGRFQVLDASLATPPLSVRCWRVLQAIALRPQGWAVAAGLLVIVWAAMNHLRDVAPQQPVKITRPAITKTAPPNPVSAAPTAVTRAPVARAGPARTGITATPGDELRVLAVLHRLGADLGEPVEVTRNDTQVMVSGVGINPVLQRQIQGELSGLPVVAVRFTEPAAAPLPAGERVPGATSPHAGVARLQAGLERHLGGRGAYDEFVNQTLDTIDTLMSRAHALRRLAERFPPEVESRLGGEEQQLLRTLRHDHAAALAGFAAGLEKRSRPALVAIGASEVGAPPIFPNQPWQTATQSLFLDARQAEMFVGILLGGTAEQTPPADLPTEVLSRLVRLRTRAEMYARSATN
jgi:hypothetical protein